MKHRFWFLVIALTLVTSPALALPCLGKLERGADHYRLVNGTKCWYVGERVPSKSEFTMKRKEVVRRDDRSKMGPRPDNATPAVALVAPPQAVPAEVWEPSAEWFMADRRDAIAALCGNPCRVGYASPSGRVQDAFDNLMALIIFDPRQATAWRSALVRQ
jgi:hypothetical protein